MDYLLPFLLWVHLLALAIGGAAVFGLPVIGSKIGSATPETRQTLFIIRDQLSSLGRAALVLLLISGPLMVWLKYGGVSGFTYWFWVKMALVAILIGVIIYGGINGKRAQGGDMAAAKRAPQVSVVAVAVYLLIIASAVLNFG